MELPDCPPGAEGYQDSVTELAKKPEHEDIIAASTKAEQEFLQHLNSLKIKTEDENYRCMVERRGRDISGMWIYLCYPCGAMCSGETVLQTHISGKKHKAKLSMRTVWPLTIFEEHPFIQNEKGVSKNKAEQEYDKVLQKMAEEVENFTTTKSELDVKYDKYREVRCHIQDTLDNVKTPLIGVEYLIEHPPEQAHYEPSYMCVLCIKQGHPRTIVNHLTCFWHRYNYLVRHFNKACTLIAPYRTQSRYREGVIVIINRLAARIQDKYGRMRPVNIDKEEYEKDRDQIHQWIFKGYHFSEHSNCTFEEVVDADLINSLDSTKAKKNVDPPPPVAAAPIKPHSKPHHQGLKRNSMDSLSDVSDETDTRFNRPNRGKPDQKRFAPYPEKRREEAPHQSSYASRSNDSSKTQNPRPPNYEYKLKLVKDQRASAEELSRKALAYHEKNPEKHPLYPEEWKKFWNRRYKEIQIEGKDPSKHDFKPEWILFWTTRMKELHEEELRSTIAEIYRRLRLTPPDTKEPDMTTEKWNEEKSENRRRSAERRRSPQKRRSPPPRRRSPEPRRRSPPTLLRRRSPDYRAVDRRSSPPRRLSPSRRSSPSRRLSPHRRSSAARRSPLPRRSSPQRRLSPLRRESPRRRSPPLRSLRTRSRSPMKLKSLPGRKAAGSPLSCRDSMPRNQSPRALQDTVLISDDELKADDLSPWNSDDTMGSLPDSRSPARRRSRTGSVASRVSRRNRSDKYREVAAPQDFGAAENVVATLRLLVALEDYLGSLGPKIVDLLAEALKMEKNKANSSEDLLESDRAVVLIETAKEKLKGAIQAGLVSSGAAAAVRTAIVRAASTLHEADIRMKKKKQRQQAQMKPEVKERGAVPVAGVGAVDREQIAQQMAAALIAQGKTDVSSEELAQLVEAVVGMAEAKKREAEAKNKTEARAANNKSTRASGTASALQMLQSAYDDKRVEKEDVPDAMDGLSDSDLETLLKNFNELSAEEQHSLIAYLKKLEAREPERVERLRQYVSIAANSTSTPIAAEEKPASKIDSQLVNIESDDDDYTVEDVFKSATQKVKEDQIRQEMEIVKKSIEESKEPPLESLVTSAGSEVQKGPFSATDLLALVQASLQSTPAPTLTSTTVMSDVVTSNTQPRSFGDLPESSLTEPLSNMQDSILTTNNQIPTQQTSVRHTQNIIDGDREGETNELTNTAWEPLQVRSSMETQQNMTNQDHGGYQDNYNQIPTGPQQHYNQGSRGRLDNNNMNSGFQGNYNQGPQGSYNQRPQGNNLGLQGNYNQQGYNDNLQSNFNQGLQENFNQGQQNNYNQEIWEHQASNNRGPQDNYNLGSRGQQNNYNQETLDNYDHDSQDSQNNQDYNRESQPSQGNFNRTPLLPFNEGHRGSQGKFNQGPRPQNFNQRGPQNYNQPPSLLNNSYNQGQGQDQSFRMRGFNNQGRGNFSGNRNQDNFNRSDGNQQQFGYQKQNNFRGRGFGGQRGRGRGYY